MDPILPDGQSSLVAALQWLQAVLLGPVATAIAVIAVAAIGFQMMQGRLPARRGAETILGCFLLFGAPGIAAGILDATRSVGGSAVASERLDPSPIPPAPALAFPSNPPLREQGYDPYAGASLVR